jgi:hypothetical protein
VTAAMGQITFDFTAKPFTAPTEKVKLEIRLGKPVNNPTLPNTITFDNASITDVGAAP